MWLSNGKAGVLQLDISWRGWIAAVSYTHLDVYKRQLDTTRPSSLEALSLPIGAARRWLNGMSVTSVADVLGSQAEQSGEEGRLVYRWTGDAETSSWISPNAIKPGNVLIVDVLADQAQHAQGAILGFLFLVAARAVKEKQHASDKHEVHTENAGGQIAAKVQGRRLTALRRTGNDRLLSW